MGTSESRTWAGPPVFGAGRTARRPCRYDAYLPDRLADRAVALPREAAADVSDAERAIHRLNAETPTVANLEALARLLLRAESVASSRIEGLAVGPRRLIRAECALAIGAQTHDVTAEAILGNVEAMQLAVDEVAAAPRLTLDHLLAIHQALMRHTDHPELGGRVREQQNWIGGNDYNPCGADFVPPPPEHVPSLLEDLVAFMRTDDYPPLVQAALVHAQFETIHPFADGNGRTGRALIHVVLKRRGLATRYVPPISLVLATRARDYVRGLTAFRFLGAPDDAKGQRGAAAWIAVFASAAARASSDAERLSSRIDALIESWRGRAAPVRARSAADLLLRALPGAPVITAATAARLIGRDRSVPNVIAAIDRLVDAGVLTQITVGRRNRAYEAVGLAELLTDFERSLATPGGDTRTADPVRPVPARRADLR